MPKYTPKDYCNMAAKIKHMPILCWYDDPKIDPFILIVDDWYSDDTVYITSNGTYWHEWPKNLNWMPCHSLMDKSWEPEDND